MNIKKTVLSASILLSCLTVAAQEPQTVTEYEFNPHWYIQGQIGGQETLGETSFGKLFAPNAQLGGGYQFTPVWGLRLSVNAWESKASIDFNGRQRWSWNYVAPMLDATMSVSNLLWGYNPKRLVNVSVLAGVGVNVGFNNGDAVAVNNMLSQQAAATTGQAIPALLNL
ncbi:MAG: OmpA family protein, partial [Muribaculaceae bacterium]|nr:OmpA family protein [Muribaculaceae bacterium]